MTTLLRRLLPSPPTVEELEQWPVMEPAKPGTVAYEAQRLDRLWPGWWRSVNTATLDISSLNRCVLAQATGSFKIAFAIVQQDICEQGDRLEFMRHYLSNACYRDKVLPSGTLDDWIAEVDTRKAA